METDFTGRNLIFLTEVNSTNSYAMQLLKNVKPDEGTIVYTNHQWAGKGQRGNVWSSQPGCNLTLSLILYPTFLAVDKQQYLYQMAALACYDTIAEFDSDGQFDIKIKWPNDILVDRRKICGILIENSLIDNSIQSSVVGIGINVNQTDFPDEIHATSLQLLTGRQIEIRKVLIRLCSQLDKYYKLLESGKYDLLKAIYEDRLFGRGEWMKFERNGRQENYRIKGLSSFGLLVLETIAGEFISADLKELRWNY